MFLVWDRLRDHLQYAMWPFAGQQHFSQSAARLCIVQQLCCMLLISTSTVLCQVTFDRPLFLFPLSVHRIGCFSDVAGVSSEDMINPFPAYPLVYFGEVGLCYLFIVQFFYLIKFWPLTAIIFSVLLVEISSFILISHNVPQKGFEKHLLTLMFKTFLRKD